MTRSEQEHTFTPENRASLFGCEEHVNLYTYNDLVDGAAFIDRQFPFINDGKRMSMVYGGAVLTAINSSDVPYFADIDIITRDESLSKTSLGNIFHIVHVKDYLEMRGIRATERAIELVFGQTNIIKESNVNFVVADSVFMAASLSLLLVNQESDPKIQQRLQYQRYFSDVINDAREFVRKLKEET